MAPAARMAWRTALALVAAEIVHDDDVAGLEGRHEDLLDIGQEALAVDRAVDARRARRSDRSAARRGRSASASGRAAPWRPAARRAAQRPWRARHVGLGPGLVDEDQARGIKPALIASSSAPAAARRRAGPARWRAGFFLKVMPFAREEVPDRVVAHLDAALGQLGHQRPQRQVRLSRRSAPAASPARPPAQTADCRPSAWPRRCRSLASAATTSPRSPRSPETSRPPPGSSRPPSTAATTRSRRSRE